MPVHCGVSTAAPEVVGLQNHSVWGGTEWELFCYSVKPGKKPTLGFKILLTSDGVQPLHIAKVFGKVLFRLMVKTYLDMLMMTLIERCDHLIIHSTLTSDFRE